MRPALLVWLAACVAAEGDGPRQTDGVGTDTTSDETAPTGPTSGTDGSDTDGTDTATPGATDTGPFDPFDPFEGTLTVLVDGHLVGDGGWIELDDTTLGHESVSTSLVLSNPTDRDLDLPGDPATWLVGDSRLRWSAPPPATLAPGATASVAIELVPDHDGPVDAALVFPSDPPVSVELVGLVHGPVPTVLVGRMGRTRVSWDHGATWDDRQDNIDPYADEWRDPSSLQSITWGDGRFVAVGGWSGEGRIAWSDDGTSWTDVEEPGEALSRVAFGRLADGTGRFAALRGNDWVWSNDGELWVTEAHDGWEGQNGMVFGGDRWVTVGSTYRGVSLDGQNWLSTVEGPSLSAVAYGNGVFVAVGSGGLVSWSADGETWNDSTLGAVNRSRIAFGDGLFLTGGYPEGMHTSPDGVTWTHHDVDAVDVLGHSNGTYVASSWRDRLWASPDGVGWTMVSDNSSPELAGFTSMAVAEPPHR